LKQQNISLGHAALSLLLLIPAGVRAQTPDASMSGGAGFVMPDNMTPAPSGGQIGQGAGQAAPQQPPASTPPSSNANAAAPALPPLSAPTSPQVPTAAPGLGIPPAAQPAPTSNGAQTYPSAPPVSLSPLTPGAVPLMLTADGVVTLVARRNLGILAALRDILASRAGVRSASALTPPLFTIGPALQMGGTTDGLIFEQSLELNGTRDARAGIARARLRLSQAQALVQLQALVYTARVNFYALASAQARLRLARDARAVAGQFNDIARRQVALGARPGIEARQTAVEAARARIQEAQAAGEEQAARAALNAYLGRAAQDPVEALLDSPARSPAPDPVAAARQALAARGEIAEAQAARDIPAAEARLSRAQGRPDLAPEFRISQITPTYMDAGVGVVITLPLDYGTRRNLVRQQESTASAGDARAVGTRAQVRLDVSQATARLAAAREALNEYDAGLLDDARAVRDSTRLGFAEGATTIIAVLDAQRTYQAVAGERLAALTQAGLAQAAFDRAVGSIPSVLIRDMQLLVEERPR